MITIKVLGDPRAMRVIACMMKHKWNIQSKFKIVRYRGSILTAALKEAGDYLRCCDMISRGICFTTPQLGPARNHLKNYMLRHVHFQLAARHVHEKSGELCYQPTREAITR